MYKVQCIQIEETSVTVRAGWDIYFAFLINHNPRETTLNGVKNVL